MPQLLFLTTASFAYDNGLGRTPPMGWNSWCTDSICNAFGADPCSEHMVKTTADAMVSSGLAALGYEYGVCLRYFREKERVLVREKRSRILSCERALLLLLLSPLPTHVTTTHLSLSLFLSLSLALSP